MTKIEHKNGHRWVESCQCHFCLKCLQPSCRVEPEEECSPLDLVRASDNDAINGRLTYLQAWLPIATAERCAKLVILGNPRWAFSTVGRFYEGRWVTQTGDHADGDIAGPTHWMPLPASPA